MSLSERFNYASNEASFWQRGIKPAIQPWIDNFNDKPYGPPNESLKNLGREFMRTAMCYMMPYRLLGGVAAATTRFSYNFIKGPK